MRKIDSSANAACSTSLSSVADRRSRPNGFSTTTLASLVQPDVGQAADHVVEEGGRDGQVEQRALDADQPLAAARSKVDGSR